LHPAELNVGCTQDLDQREQMAHLDANLHHPNMNSRTTTPYGAIV
jgi:hypothetical protein